MSRRNAIVCLTRGYANLAGYALLIARNRAIYDIINRHRNPQYPLIIWHEGNIPTEHQLYVSAFEWNADLQFVDVSRVFHLPRSVRQEELAENWTVNYRLMCRFHSFYIWQYTTPFDYIMRVDEDCILKSSLGDPIEALADAEGDFAAARFTKESHGLTNLTLSKFVESFAAGLHRSNGKDLYNQVFPYTNLYVTRTGFWRLPQVQAFLDAVRRDPDSLRFRWGDLPVLGVALNLFAKHDKVFRLRALGYWHGSHGRTVTPELATAGPDELL